MTDLTRIWIEALERHMRFRIDPSVPSHAKMIREIEQTILENSACEHGTRTGFFCHLCYKQSKRG